MQVLITRAEPAATKTAKVLASAGIPSIKFPLFVVKDSGVPVSDGDYAGVIFTSSNAAFVLAQRNWRNNKPDCIAYCVGDKTAEAAENLGFSQIIVTHGGASVLAKKIIQDFQGKARQFFYPAPKTRAFDMISVLGEQEIGVEMVEIYSHDLQKPDRSALQSLPECVIVPAYSEKSAVHIAEVLFGGSGQESKFRPTLVAISRKTAESVLKYPWAGVYVADKPNEAAMVEKIKELTLRKPDAGHIL